MQIGNCCNTNNLKEIEIIYQSNIDQFILKKCPTCQKFWLNRILEKDWFSNIQLKEDEHEAWYIGLSANELDSLNNKEFDKISCNNGYFHISTAKEESNWRTILDTNEHKIIKELFSMELYQKHLAIALKAHKDQLTPYGLPYAFHILSVATEIIHALPFENIRLDEADVAIACALLHDVIEDTDYDLSKEKLDPIILNGIKALTKDKSLLTKQAQMKDSLDRLKLLPEYIQMVKIADRITNLGIPPSHWDSKKIISYKEEAKTIMTELTSPNMYLVTKLSDKINTYTKNMSI